MSDEEFNKLLQTISQKKNKSNPSTQTPNSAELVRSSSFDKKYKILFQNAFNKTTDTIVRNTKQMQVNYLTINQMFNEHGKKQSIDQLLKGTSKEIWQVALSNELGRLVQGVRSIKGNDVINFIKHSDIPKHKVVTYASKHGLRHQTIKNRKISSETYSWWGSSTIPG